MCSVELSKFVTMLTLFILFIFGSVATADPLRNNHLSNYKTRIIGGQNASIEDYPYQVSFLFDGVHHCGGAIISDRWVLTNAVCDVNKGVKVRSGSVFNNEGGSLHTVIKTIKHEDFKVTEERIPLNDIALVQVDETFKFDKTRQPIPLSNVDEQVEPGSIGKLVGWGETESGEFSKYLLSISVPIVPKEKCNDIYSVTGGIQKDQICAGYLQGGKDFCIGDAGSALIVNGKAVGIVSWGINCGQSNYPGVYTKIAAHRFWINKKLQEN